MTRGPKEKYELVIKPHLAEIKDYKKEGATDKEIADYFGISVSALSSYKNKYPELAEALRPSKLDTVFKARKALIKRAFGYYVHEEKTRFFQNKDGDVIEKTEVTERWIPEDVGALAMLLRNLTESWRDKDHTTIKQKNREIKVREKVAESNDW